MISDDERTDLVNLLRERLAVVGDQSLRTADPERHLAELQRVSEAIVKKHQQLKGRIPPRLEHFLGQCSFDKALALLEGTAFESAH